MSDKYVVIGAKMAMKGPVCAAFVLGPVSSGSHGCGNHGERDGACDAKEFMQDMIASTFFRADMYGE